MQEVLCVTARLLLSVWYSSFVKRLARNVAGNLDSSPYSEVICQATLSRIDIKESVSWLCCYVIRSLVLCHLEISEPLELGLGMIDRWTQSRHI